MLSSDIENMLRKRLGYGQSEIARVIYDFVVVTDVTTNYGAKFERDLYYFAQDHVRAEEARRKQTIKSVIIEHPEPEKYRFIVFEMDYRGCNSVLDIGEADSLKTLEKVFKKRHNDVRHLASGSEPIKAVDAWAAAVATMRVGFEELS